MLLLLNKMAVKPRLSTTKMASNHVIALNQDDAEAIALPFLALSKDGHKSCVGSMEQQSFPQAYVVAVY